MSDRPVIIECDRDATLQRMVSRYNELTGRELSPMNPMYIALQVIASELFLHQLRVNDAIVSQLIDFASFPILDQLGLLKGIPRHEGELDSEYRERIRLGWNDLAAGRPYETYITMAKKVSSSILDVACYSEPHSGVMQVYVLTKDRWSASQLAAEKAKPVGQKTKVGDEYLEVLMESLLEEVRLACQNSPDRPGTDLVVVSYPEAVEWMLEIELILKEGTPTDLAATLAASKAALQSYVDDRSNRLGGDVILSHLIKIAKVEGVHDVIVGRPMGNVSVSYNQFAKNVLFSVTAVGVSDEQ